MSKNNININQKIEDIPKEENNKRLEIISDENNHTSFDQMLSLQLLIQKHSGLKELCKYYFSL